MKEQIFEEFGPEQAKAERQAAIEQAKELIVKWGIQQHELYIISYTYLPK